MSLAAVLEPSGLAAPALGSSALVGGDLTAEVAMRWACAPARWRDDVRHVDGARHYQLLFEDERVSGWLITWAPGTGLELHDHGGAVGSVVVVDGALTERFRDRRRVEPVATRELTAGSMVTFSADHVHEVVNRGAEPAVSIHVYAPTLDGMTFYEEHPSASGLRPTRSEPVDQARSATPATPGPRQEPHRATGLPPALARAWLNGFR